MNKYDKRNKVRGSLVPYINKPGIVFSFDDSFRIQDWYRYGKDIFGYYDIKSTFNINNINSFEGGREHTQNEIDMLIELQANGHEIAHHGYRHKRAVQYSTEVGIDGWIKDEITYLFNWMEVQSHSKTKERFKKPVSFAFPGFRYNDRTINELVPKYFKIVRGHLKDTNLTPFNHTGFAASICIDSHLLTNAKFLKKILRSVKRSGQNLIITCHSILPEDVTWKEFGWQMSQEAGKWRTSPKIILEIINEAKKLDLEFYTTAEIGGVATFIDPHLEKCIREILKNPNEKWISIKELQTITELDLRSKNISNLDGIQYFLNLEKLKINNNKVKDFRLLKKLPKLVEIDINYKHAKKEDKVNDLLNIV